MITTNVWRGQSPTARVASTGRWPKQASDTQRRGHPQDRRHCGLRFWLGRLKGFGAKTIDALKRAATARCSGKPLVFCKPALATAQLAIYFDFEDDPTQELIYLRGLLCDPPIRPFPYVSFFAASRDGEATLWAGFQEFCAEIEQLDYLVFHYSSYEKAKLRQLQSRHGLSRVDAVAKFRSKMVDLHHVVTNSVALPTRGYGLKHVAPLAGHCYSSANAGGSQSIVWFQKVQADPLDQQIFDSLLTYNQEDCRALKCVHDWLLTLT